ncbi:MAG: prevent-host-death protein [Armatimonadetes bacterium CG2_30_59_28]|nr:type II toxin-antitoxin system Phd/YefM family antitoxin [Armatimonadota bacterium]OIO97524.1 MAG: prevent-host-death protein [Armatimonadetes bacterium CG2_30_59_28]PIU64292.1 MAG: type II toxin-antitoxin system prevent-host-death family antitoxin [Armatimonadetes bacterium CG07_land_8_20_14_0_80_59_28]PIX38156.1 MAG: type II toxin-antitoxin system prevent-host-death family antitoxin [Armatimonadetes bacterium CG_4_8_14_3_um_filter_58_9]PIY45577.1 MAG: type II toxin-antitoxin system prevent
METIGAHEARNQFSSLLERVHRGARVAITKRGVTVAVLQPPDHILTGGTESVIAELRTFRRRHRLNGLQIRDLIEEGRR